MLNATQIIWEYLTTADTSLYTLCAKRIWSGEPPRIRGGWKNDEAAIVFDVITVDPHITGGTLECIVDFTCFGGDADNDHATHANAETVYRALNDRLHGRTGQTASGAIMIAEQTGGRLGQREPETEWPFAEATYRIVVQTAAA